MLSLGKIRTGGTSLLRTSPRPAAIASVLPGFASIGSAITWENVSLQIMGKWYVVEILEHRADPQKLVSGSYIVDSCPIVKLKPLEHGSLKLLWSEGAGNLEYSFRIPEIPKRSGLWRTISLQNGISLYSLRALREIIG